MRSRPRSRAASGCLLLCLAAGALLAGCCGGGSSKVAWNAVLGSSLDPVLPPPAARPNDPYPSTCTVASEQSADGGYAQSDATCYLHASVQAVWQALQDPTVTEDPHTVDFSVTAVADSNPQHPIHEIIHYDLVDILDVSYDLEWIHILDSGTVAAPEQVVVTFQKIDGTIYVPLWEDSFELTSPSSGVTLLAISAHQNASYTGPSDVQNEVVRYYTNLVAKLGVPGTPP